MSFLISDKGGLGLDVAQDNETKKAMQNALIPLLNEEIENLKGKRLDKDFFNSLLTGGDPVRDILHWLDQDVVFKSNRSNEEWNAFTDICKSDFGIDPDKDGLLSGIQKLVSLPAKASGAGIDIAWQKVWERYYESPKRYPLIPDKIRKLQVPNDTIFWIQNDGAYDRYPQWNDEMEDRLRKDLIAVSKLQIKAARIRIMELEKQHGRRRDLIWTELGESRYAHIIKQLDIIAHQTEQGMDAGTLEEIEIKYSEGQWQADLAILRVLLLIETNDDTNIIKNILNILYLPWLDNSARYIQKDLCSPVRERTVGYDASKTEAVLFVDGLRFDCAKQLAVWLREDAFEVKESHRWAGLPTITATCKPMILRESLNNFNGNESDPSKFEAVSSYGLKKRMETDNWMVLSNGEAIPSPIRNGNHIEKRLWIEIGNLDQLGHSQGWKLSKHLDSILNELRILVKSILNAGWSNVRIVSDHGWLLLPGGLPKSELSPQLAESKWARFATIKSGASTTEQVFPWFWDSHQQFAIADGISCYRNGVEFTHGGLSIQECLLLDLEVTSNTPTNSRSFINITDIKWTGLRCTIAVEGEADGLLMDIRTSAADSLSSIVLKVNPIKNNITASVVIEDESLEGTGAYIVLIDSTDAIVSQIHTIISGGENDSTR
jgi:hypothetical protein